MPARRLFIPCNASAIVFSVLTSALLPNVARAKANDNCQMQISSPVIDYGQITRAELLERQVSPTAFSLGKQTMTLTATCRQPTLMTFYFRAASGDANSYSFGNYGSFTLKMATAQIDGRRVRLGNVHTADEPPDRLAESAAIIPGVGVVPVVDARPVRGKSFSVQVEIETQVLGAFSRIADRTVWRSSGSFELVEN